MLAIFASAEAGPGGTGLFYNPLVLILMVVVAIYIFLKYCQWAKNFQLSGKLKKWYSFLLV